MSGVRPAGMEKFAELFQKRPDSMPGAIKPGLQRIQMAYDHLGRPGRDIPTILVGGTNGKGGTATSLWQMLALAGHRPGLYTSPHLVDFSERYAVAGAGQEINDDRLIEVHGRLKYALGDLYDPMSFFEVATLLALALFVEERVSHLVLEVGLGGRLDATNVVDPVVSIITSIGLDHQAFLGSDPATIAMEKAGIMRSGKVILWAGKQAGTPAADLEIRTQAQIKGAHLEVLGEDFERFDGGDGAPEFLVANRSLARQALIHLLGAAAWPMVAERWPQRQSLPSLRGRFQFVANGYAGRDLLVDVCHNPDGARAFVQAFVAAFPDLNPPVFVTCSADKDHAAIAAELQKVFSPLVFFPTQAERSWRPTAAELPAGTVWQDDLEQAVAHYATHSPVVICGSVLGIGNLIANHQLQIGNA